MDIDQIVAPIQPIMKNKLDNAITKRDDRTVNVNNQHSDDDYVDTNTDTFEHVDTYPSYLYDSMGRYAGNRITRRIYAEYKMPEVEPGVDVRTTLPTAPLYGGDDSYSAYVNQNNNNQNYEEAIHNKPHKSVQNTTDYIHKYFCEDGRTFRDSPLVE
jgi:epoxyqueuosine reductase QueG